jgi:Glycosyltransferase family 87
MNTCAPFSPRLQRLFLLLVVIQAALAVQQLAASFSPPRLYRKDFMADYLPARAILNQVSPYLPLPALAARVWPETPYQWIQHPTPHPPFLVVLFTPLGLLQYERAVQVWFVLQLSGLLGVIVFLVRGWGSDPRFKLLLGLLLMALSWTPIFHELWFGQLNIGLLLLLLGAWWAWRTEREILGGALWGLVIALKLIVWPGILLLLLRRQWRSAVAACGMVLAANLLATAVMGVAPIQHYYLQVGPQVAAIYRTDDYNYSTWTFGSRLFRGSGTEYRVPPLWRSDALATSCDWGFPLLMLCGGILTAWRTRQMDTALGLITGISILVSPTAWVYNLVLAILPIFIILRRLKHLQYPRKLCYLTILLLLTPVLGSVAYRSLGLLTEVVTAEGMHTLPFAVSLLTLAPAVSLIGLLVLLWTLDNVMVTESSVDSVGEQVDK